MSAAAILEARDFLIRHRSDYATAYRDFRAPEIGAFNWALDWFDAVGIAIYAVFGTWKRSPLACLYCPQ